MIITVQQAHLDIHQLIPCKETTLHRVLNSLLDRLDVLLGDRAAGNLVFKYKALAGRRLNLDLDVAELSATTGLLFVNLFAGCSLRNRFTISDLRLAHVCFDTKLALHAIDNNLQVKLSHASNDCLARFMIGGNVKRRIFLGQTVQRYTELVLILTSLGLNCDANNRGGKLHSLENDWLVLITNRVARRYLFHAANRNDLASARIFDIFALVGVHAHQAPDTLFSFFNRIVGI